MTYYIFGYEKFKEMHKNGEIGGKDAVYIQGIECSKNVDIEQCSIYDSSFASIKFKWCEMKLNICYDSYFPLNGTRNTFRVIL